jgi:hypothetical protein
LEARHGELQEELRRLERFVFGARMRNHQNPSSFDAHDASNSIRTQSTADSVGLQPRSNQQSQAGNTLASNYVSSEVMPRRVEYPELPDNSSLWEQLTVPHDVDHHRPPWNNVGGRWPYQYMAQLRPFPYDPNNLGLSLFAQAVVDERWRCMRTREEPGHDLDLQVVYSVAGVREDLGC